MRRGYLSVALIVCLAGCATSTTARVAPTTAADRVSSWQASVQPLRDSEGEAYCTAFAVAPEIWMTAKHCAPTNDGETLGNWGKPAVTVYRDEDTDIALVRAWPAVEPIVLAAEAPSAGDTLSTAGYGDRGLPEPRLTARSGLLLFEQLRMLGVVSSFVGIDTAHGDSGSPVVDARGRLVGVLWGFNPLTHLTAYVPFEDTERVLGLMTAMNASQSDARWPVGAGTTPVMRR